MRVLSTLSFLLATKWAVAGPAPAVLASVPTLTDLGLVFLIVAIGFVGGLLVRRASK